MNEATHSKHGRVPYHNGWTPLVMPDNAFMIFDDEARKSECIYESWSKDSEKEIASGMVKKGNTIEELARQLGIDPDGLRRQIDFYNEQWAKGEDLQFKRGKRYLKPLLSTVSKSRKPSRIRRAARNAMSEPNLSNAAAV